MKFLKSLIFLVKFQFSVTRKFFQNGYWKDYGSIEAYFLTRSYLLRAAKEMDQIERDLDRALSGISKESKDGTRPKFNVVPKDDDRLN